jgi:hypothetical protein
MASDAEDEGHIEHLEAKFLVDKQKRIENAMSWHPKQEKLIKSWGEKALGYRWIHHRCAVRHSSAHTRFSIINIAMTTLAGLGTLVASSEDENSQILLYVFSFLNLSAAGIASVHKFLRCGEQYESNMQTSKLFSRLARDISLELSLEPEDRMNAVEYCHKVREDYDKIIDHAPEVPSDIIKEYKTMMDEEDPENKLARPEMANGKFKIYSSSERVDNASIEEHTTRWVNVLNKAAGMWRSLPQASQSERPTRASVASVV